MAFMLGYYSTDPNYPEGVRINVESLYEPPQSAQEKNFKINRDNAEAYRDLIGSALQLEIVGMVYTRARGSGKIATLESHEVRRMA